MDDRTSGRDRIRTREASDYGSLVGSRSREQLNRVDRLGCRSQVEDPTRLREPCCIAVATREPVTVCRSRCVIKISDVSETIKVSNHVMTFV